MGNEINLEDEMRRATSKKEKNKDSFKNKIHFKYGGIAAGALIALFLLYYAMGWYFDKDYKSWIPSIIFMLLIVVAQFHHTRIIKEDISFGNLFAKGFKTAAVGTCIYVLFLFIFIWAVPEYKESMIAMSKDKMASSGMSVKDIKVNIDRAQDYFTAYAISGAVLGELILGLIASLAGAVAAPKNQKPELKPLS